MHSPKKKHYYNPWFFKRFKFINKSFFINGLKVWGLDYMCIFKLANLIEITYFDYLSN